MTDLANLSVAALLILLGAIGIFLWIGGKSENFELPKEVSDNKRNFVGFGGTLFLIIGLVLGTMPLFEPFPSRGESTPLPSPTNTIEAIVESTAIPIPPTNPPEPTDEPAETETAVSPTNTPRPVATEEIETAVSPTSPPLPTITPTSEPTAVPTPEPTSEPEPTRDEIIQIVSIDSDNWIYAGPDTINVRLGAMQSQENGVVLGKDKWENWVKVKTEREITGWVILENVEFITGTLAEVPVAWPLSTSAVESTTTSPDVGGQCMAVYLSSQDWPSKEFDDIWIRWSNVPEDAQEIRIRVDGSVNGENLPLIYPALSEIDEGEYYIGYWKFIERGFSTNVTFIYTLQAIAENNETICTITGSFEQ